MPKLVDSNTPSQQPRDGDQDVVLAAALYVGDVKSAGERAVVTRRLQQRVPGEGPAVVTARRQRHREDSRDQRDGGGDPEQPQRMGS